MLLQMQYCKNIYYEETEKKSCQQMHFNVIFVGFSSSFFIKIELENTKIYSNQLQNLCLWKFLFL
jgi:hypothetical protein